MVKKNLTPTKSECGEKIHIWADVYAQIFGGAHFAARPALYRIVLCPHEIDSPDDPAKGALLTIPVEDAKKFAKELLELVGE